MIQTLTNQPETRSLTLKTLELRTAPEGRSSPGVVTGIAVPYNEWADIGGYFREQIKPGAFACKQPDNQFAYRNHNWDDVLGSTQAGTLKFRDSAEGMRFEVELPDTSVGRDFAVLIQRGDVKGASIGFLVKANEWRFAEKKGEVDERIITEAEILEVSLTHIPAYSGTSASMRSQATESRDLHAAAKEQRAAELAARERESLLLSLPFSRS